MDTNKRLLSIDTLRGMDMLLIRGLGPVLMAICLLFPNGEDSWLAIQLHHAEWDGLRIEDMIFPFFLFISGLSFPFSHAKQLEKGMSKKAIYLKIFRRAVSLFLVGLLFNGFLRLKLDSFRIFSVLGRIGFAWMAAAMLFITFKRRTCLLISAFILAAYALLTSLVTAPDAPAGCGPLSLEGNIVGYVDRTLFGNHLHIKNEFDPEGLLGTFPAIVTAMLGIFTGDYVRRQEDSTSMQMKKMLGASVLLLSLGLLLSIKVPVNKSLWSSSFVLVAGGIELMVFSIFHWIIDIRGVSRWTFPFRVVGMNSIFVYVLPRFFSIGFTAEFFLNGIASMLPQQYAALLLALGKLAVIWLLLYFMYKKKIFIKL